MAAHPDEIDGEDEGQGARRGRLSGAEAAELSRQVAELGRAGLPLPSGLRALAEESRPPRLRAALIQLADRVEAGRSLDEAIAAEGDRLPPHLQGLILAGVRSGRLGEALERFADQQRLGSELRRGLWMALAYPLALLTLISGLFLFVATMLVRPLLSTFQDFGMELPRISMALVRAVDAAEEFGGLMLAGTVGGLVLVGLAVLSLGRGPLGRSLTGRIPLFGPLRRWTILADFTRLLGLLIEGEVPLPEALGLVGAGLGDRDVEAVCRGLRAEVERGRPLSGAIAARRELPPGLARLVGWAEVGRSLPGALNLAGELYEARARAQARFVAVACTCAAILAVFWGAIFVVFALFLPMIQLVSKLSG